MGLQRSHLIFERDQTLGSGRIVGVKAWRSSVTSFPLEA